MNEKPRILIVDDDLYMRRLLLFKLTNAGYQVSLASNGLEAIKLIRSEAPDLILSDVFMPHISGLDFFEKLKETSSHIPMIFMSAADLPLDHKVMEIASPANFMAKPFLLKHLLIKIDNLLSTTLA